MEKDSKVAGPGTGNLDGQLGKAVEHLNTLGKTGRSEVENSRREKPLLKPKNMKQC